MEARWGRRFVEGGEQGIEAMLIDRYLLVRGFGWEFVKGRREEGKSGPSCLDASGCVLAALVFFDFPVV